MHIGCFHLCTLPGRCFDSIILLIVKVLENIDSKLEENGGNGGVGGVDEYRLTTGISANEYGNDNDNDNNSDNNDNETRAFLTNDKNDNNDNHNSNKATKKQEEDEICNSMRSDAQGEAYRRMGMEITFMTPLLQDEVSAGVKLNSNLWCKWKWKWKCI